MSLTTRVLLGLGAGLLAGVLLAASQAPVLATVIAVVEPAGTIFINAIRMTVIPLVVSSLIVGVASSSDARAIGRLGGQALLLFVAALLVAAVAGALIVPPLLALLPLDAAATEALRASASSAAVGTAERASRLPSTGQWLIDLVPANPIKAGADGAILPLIVFALGFGLALTRVERATRESVVRFFQGIADAMLVLVRWVLALAPIGVFALALPLAARMGLAAAGALAYYIALVVATFLGIMLLVLYPAAVLLGRVPLRTFVRASAPAQAVAFSSRSSLASLPAMIEGARSKLRSDEEITGFFLPLAASVFRVGSAIQIVAGALFIAKLYGVSVGAGALAALVVTAIVTSFSVPGVPGGSILVIAPALAAAGLPIEGVGILLGIDTIPDMFRTTTNVTGHMSVAAILGRRRAAAAAPLAPAA